MDFQKVIWKRLECCKCIGNKIRTKYEQKAAEAREQK